MAENYLRLDHVISHPSLGKPILITYMTKDLDVYLVDCNQRSDENDNIFYRVFVQNLNTSVIRSFDGRINKRLSAWETALLPHNVEVVEANYLLKLTVASLLDESVDSKQLFQALKSEGVDLGTVTLFKNYLGKWEVRDDLGVVLPLKLLLVAISRKASVDSIIHSNPKTLAKYIEERTKLEKKSS